MPNLVSKRSFITNCDKEMSARGQDLPPSSPQTLGKFGVPYFHDFAAEVFLLTLKYEKLLTLSDFGWKVHISVSQLFPRTILDDFIPADATKSKSFAFITVFLFYVNKSVI